MTFTHQDIAELKDLAHKALTRADLNGVMDGQGQQPLHDTDRLALAYLEASLTLLGRKGALTSVAASVILTNQVQCSSVWEE